MRRFLYTILFIIVSGVIALSSFYYYVMFYDNLPSFTSKAPKKWMVQQIEKDLKPFQSGITKDQIDKVMRLAKENNLSLAKIKIIDNKVDCGAQTNSHLNLSNSKRFKVFCNKLQNLSQKGAKFSDVEFILFTWDDPDAVDGLPTSVRDSKENLFRPIFTYAANKESPYRKDYILVPDDFTMANKKLGYSKGWFTYSQELIISNAMYPWDKKLSIAFWRGKYYGSGVYDRYRGKLLEYSRQFPNLIDAKNNALLPQSFFSILYEAIAMKFGIPPYLSQDEFLNYKMMINLDGNTSSYPGFLWKLFSNSVVLKQTTPNEQWFYNALTPWKHYIPVQQDLSDIIEKVKWVQQNDAKAKEIADNANQFVKDNLMIEDIDLYLVTLLNEYAKLQKFKPDGAK